MKPLELTEEQRVKLLEMCKFLFPDHDFILNKWEQCTVTFGLKSKQLYEHHIHWFEFVMVYLVGKLQESMPNEMVFRPQPPYVNNIFDWKEGNKWSFYSEFMFHYPKAMSGGNRIIPQNPIDYLYQEFKRLKQ